VLFYCNFSCPECALSQREKKRILKCARSLLGTLPDLTKIFKMLSKSHQNTAFGKPIDNSIL
jgi:hypothetical protein